MPESVDRRSFLIGGMLAAMTAGGAASPVVAVPDRVGAKRDRVCVTAMRTLGLIAVLVGASAVGLVGGVSLAKRLVPVDCAGGSAVAGSAGGSGRSVAERVSESEPERVAVRTGEYGRLQNGGESGGSGKLIAEVRHGPYRAQAVQVAGIRGDGTVDARSLDPNAARRGLGVTIRHALRQRGKAPLHERYARTTQHPFSSEEFTDKNARIYPGDVFLSGIPMIDQGKSAYCAVASAARVLQGYGIEVTMEDMATMAGSSETGGTRIDRWDQALRKVANEHGLELKVVSELTEATKPISNLVYDYNQTARDMGYDDLDPWKYSRAFYADYKSFWEDREYPVQREVMVSDEGKRDAFDDNVTARIDDSDPLFWSVTLGDVAEEVPYSDEPVTSSERESHMRLIIGYNEQRGEVLYSDSWGEGHELKRMDAEDALSITKGMYYLTD